MRHICKSTVPKSLDDFKEQKHTMWKEIHESIINMYMMIA